MRLKFVIPFVVILGVLQILVFLFFTRNHIQVVEKSKQQWSKGLFNKKLNNNESECKISFGETESWRFPPLRENFCFKTDFSWLMGQDQNRLIINSKCRPDREENYDEFLLNCRKIKAKTEPNIEIDDECPSFYFYFGKNTTKPFYKGYWYFEDIEIPNDQEYIVTRCRVYSNTLIRISKSPTKQMNKKLPNVKILLLDGISRAHFHRRMKYTKEILEKNNSFYSIVEYFKFVVNDYSSNSNLTPFMSGVEWWRYCNHKFKCEFTKNIKKGRFLWQKYRNHGYKTMISMELCWVKYQADWFFESNGWDHYFGFPIGRDLKECLISHEPECIHGARPHHIMLDYLKKFDETYSNEPRFSFNLFLETHETSMSVQDILDQDLSIYLENLMKKEENSWIILMSDHGIHYGPFFDHTATGRLEQKLPLLIIIAPNQFKEEYPEKWKNIVINSQRLVTHYDLHEFIGSLSNSYQGIIQEDDIEKKGMNIFEEIPFQRNCEDASIPEYSCICNKDLYQIKYGWRECGSGSHQQIC